MKILLRFAWILPILLFCSGCSATQVRDRMYVQAIELSDYSHPTMQIHIFESDGTRCSGTGNTLTAALEQAEIPAGKELFLGHLELLSLQDPLFSSQLSDIMKDYRLSSGCKVLCPSSAISLESVNTERLLNSLKQEETNGYLPKTDLLSILKELSNADHTALLPLYTGKGFSMTLLTNTELAGTLSSQAIQGLCWLRGQNYPQHITVSVDEKKESFEIYHASTKLSATMQNGTPIVTVTLSIRGKGNAEALKAELETLCIAAEKETVNRHKADVFGLEACIRQQCYQAYVGQNWDTLRSAVQFTHQIKISTN